MSRLPLVLALLVMPFALSAQESDGDTSPETRPEAAEPAPETTVEAPMTLERMDEIVRALDPDAQTNGRMWRLIIADTPVLIITDPENDRMRALAAVGEVSEIDEADLTRMMQANFDSALDARYAIAKETVWSTYIHPFKPLEKDQLISGLGQVVNLVQSYGTLYSGGAMQFGGGDSGTLQRELIDELLKKGEEL
ncbi:MAG: type III secretion system chaperone [Pseudomonadota bacterium]